MGVVARGAVQDRPWGRTLSFVADRRFSGELIVDADGKRYIVGFDDGAVVTAFSPLATDAAVRVALTAGLVTSSQVAEITRFVAAHPNHDEVDAVATAARLGRDQADRLRRRVIAHRAIRGFALDRGDFVLVDERSLGFVPEHAIDVRALIYLGARTHMTEQRLLQELARLGPGFQLRAAAIAGLPQYGFGEAEKPVLAALRAAPIAVLDLDEAAPELDHRTVRAIVYSLAVTNALDISATSVGSDRPRHPTPPTHLDRSRRTTPTSSRTRTRPPSQPGLKQPGSSPSIRLPEAHTERAGRPSRPLTPPYGTPRPATQPPRAKTDPNLSMDSSSRNRKTSTPGLERPRKPSTAMPSADEPATLRGAAAGRPTGRDERPEAPASPSHGAPAARARASSTPATGIDSRAHRRPARRSTLHAIDIPVAAEVRALIKDRTALLGQGADYFSLLGVTAETSPDQIRKVYFGLARQLHPDRLTALGIEDTDREAQRLFAQINTAFAVLSSPMRRTEYARMLLAGGEEAVRAQQDQAEEITRRILTAEEKFRIGEMALRRDQLDVALEHFKQAVELNPDEADHHALLGWTIFVAAPDKNAVLKTAKGLLDKAARMSEKAVAPRLYLGRMARMLGRDAEARKMFEEVVAISPHHTEATSELRLLEQRAGSTTKPPDNKGGGLFGRFKK
jgi:hypothetical protein